jgi:cobalt-zinc-cadmium efflux system membrane fusion protein
MKKILTVLIISLSLLASCSNKADLQKTTAEADAKPSISWYKVTVQKVPVFIEATGTVQPDLDGGAKILTPLSGVVSRMFVRIGDSVRKGDALIAVQSSEMNDAYSGYLSAVAQLRQAERLYNLNKELLAIGAITKNDFLASEASYEQWKALNEGLKRKLDMYGVGTAEGFCDQLILKAPIDGRVADIAAHIGDRFDTVSPLLNIVNPERLLVVANLYDMDVAKIRKGQTVTFFTDVFPALEFHGTVTYLSDAEDVESKTVKTFIRLEDNRGLFKQNMFLKIRIFQEEKLMPVVAKTCLIYKDGKFYVYLRKAGAFELHEVRMAFEVSEKLVAVEQLNEGDEVADSAINLEKS